MTVSFSGPGLWYATRAAGLVALLMMTLSVLLGVLTAGRFSSPRWPRFLTVGLHRNLSLLVLAFLALHIGTTVLDSYTSIQLSAAFIPFVSSYKRGWLGLGAIAFDLLIVLAATSLTRIRLGHRAWRLVHWSGGVIPGAYGGLMGPRRDPFFIEASPYGNPFWRGAYPEYTFPNHTKKPPEGRDERVYQAPNLTLAPGMSPGRLSDRTDLLEKLDLKRRDLERSATFERYDQHRQVEA